MAVTLLALAAFDIAAVMQLRRYLISQADAQLRNVISLYQPSNLPGTTTRTTAYVHVPQSAWPRVSVNRTVGRLELILIIGSMMADLMVLLGGGWLIRRGLQPIETMAAQADRITAGDLTGRVGPPETSTEVGRLGAALDGMLTRIEAAVQERDASQQLTRQFFADASHELRNPLASLRANAELYRQGAIPDRAGTDQAMHRIESEAQRMSQLVDDMLRLARLDQQRDHIDLTTLITGCAERARQASPTRTWHLQVTGRLMVVGDEEMLRRAIDNLLANARTHTPDGSTVSITAAVHGGQARIEVSDDGPGVPASQLPRIFDRFYRASAPNQRPGSGLGLAIVTAIAAAHHGAVQATPNQPHGLRVTLTLPSPQPACHPHLQVPRGPLFSHRTHTRVTSAAGTVVVG